MKTLCEQREVQQTLLFYVCCLLTCGLKAMVACSILVLYFFNLYMGPNLFHDMWAPRCVVCSTLICGSKFVPFQVDYRCVVL